MTVAREPGRVVGHGVVTKWTPDDLRVKTELEVELIKKGFVGLDLEREALTRLERDYAIVPFETKEGYNILVTVGQTQFLNLLIGANANVYNNANACLAVGDTATAPAIGQTDLQGAAWTTNKLKKAMDATYPSVATNVGTFRSTFATGDANFAWLEWAIYNGISMPNTNTMLNRANPNLGTKTSAASWQLTVTITLT